MAGDCGWNRLEEDDDAYDDDEEEDEDDDDGGGGGGDDDDDDDDGGGGGGGDDDDDDDDGGDDDDGDDDDDDEEDEDDDDDDDDDDDNDINDITGTGNRFIYHDFDKIRTWRYALLYWIIDTSNYKISSFYCEDDLGMLCSLNGDGNKCRKSASRIH
nr:unnamed protein product [Spirometra erinaceieuropaei]